MILIQLHFSFYRECTGTAGLEIIPTNQGAYACLRECGARPLVMFTDSIEVARHLSYSPNFLEEVIYGYILGTTMGVIRGDARSLDDGSFGFIYIHALQFFKVVVLQVSVSGPFTMSLGVYAGMTGLAQTQGRKRKLP